MKRLATWTACVLVSVVTACADRYVATSGNTPDGVYSNWATAAATIQAAVNVAAAGETIHVGDGTYYSTGGVNGAVSLTKAVTLVSENGADATIIDGNFPARTNRCLYMVNSGARVDGFTIRNGYFSGSSYGAGVYMTNGFLANSLVIGNTSAYHAAGVYMTGGTMTNCSVSSNMITAGSGQYWAAGLILTGGVVSNCQVVGNENKQSYGRSAGIHMAGGLLAGSTVAGNIATNYGLGIGMYVIGGVISGCTIADNIGTNSSGGGLYVGGGITASVCAVTGNINGSGGGLYLATGASLVTNCTVAGNRGYAGAGGIALAVAGGGSQIINCLVSNNTGAGNAAAGISLAAAARVSGCVVVTNRGYYGGLDITADNILVEDTRMEDNRASNNGGGMNLYKTLSSNVLVRRCGFANNTAAANGGGLSMQSGVVSNCLVVGNIATTTAGGISMTGGLLVNSVISSNRTPGTGGGVYGNPVGELRNCLVVSNVAGSSGGVHVQGGAGQLQNCTISGNVSTNSYGGGVMSWIGSAALTNCIVTGNFLKAATNNWSNQATNMAYCCTTPLTGITGPGNTTADPTFVDAANGHFQLQKGSPCKDTGIQLGWMTNALDLAQKSRLVGASVDMGAYEVQPRPTGALMSVR